MVEDKLSSFRIIRTSGQYWIEISDLIQVIGQLSIERAGEEASLVLAGLEVLLADAAVAARDVIEQGFVNVRKLDA